MDLWRMISQWFCDSESTTETANLQATCILGALRRGPHSGVTPEVGHGMLAWLKAASSGEIRRWSAGALEASSRSAPLLKSLVRMTAPSFMQRSRMSRNSAMNKKPPLGGLVVDVNTGDR